MRRYVWKLAALGAFVPGAGLLAQVSIHGDQQIDAGPLSVELSKDRESMNVAESLLISLDATAPSSVSVELPRPGDKLGNFSVVSVADEPAMFVAAGTKTRVVRRITLEPFLPGEYTLPALEVHWLRLDTGESGVVRTTPETIKVVSLLPEAAQTNDADIKTLDPGAIRERYTPPRVRSWGPLLLGVGTGISLLAGWGALAMRRRRGHRDPLAAMVSHIEALGGQPDVDASEFCQELSESLRAGLSERVNPWAGSLLATEVAERLPTNAFFSKQLAMDCGRLFGVLDEVRFSGRDLAADERSTLREETLSILRALLAMPRAEDQA
jgi:hypothetical protein